MNHDRTASQQSLSKSWAQSAKILSILAKPLILLAPSRVHQLRAKSITSKKWDIKFSRAIIVPFAPSVPPYPTIGIFLDDCYLPTTAQQSRNTGNDSEP